MTTSVPDLAALMDEVDDATRSLRRSETVPEDVERLVESFDERLHAESPLRLDVDPYLSAALFAGALRAVKALRHDNRQDQRRDVRIALEQVRLALRNILDGAPVSADAPVRQVLGELVALLPAPQAEVADLLGISTRQLQRWLDPQGPVPAGSDEARVRISAQLANHLRHVFTGPGVLAWFRRRHPHLGERPVDLLDDPARYPELRSLAAASRAMAG